MRKAGAWFCGGGALLLAGVWRPSPCSAFCSSSGPPSSGAGRPEQQQQPRYTEDIPGTYLDISTITERAQNVNRDVKPGFRTGFCTIVGAPNSGKSTLMNRMVGERLSIVTPKAQTTRHRIMGIATSDDYQIVYSDTPGVLTPSYELQQGMMNFVKEAMGDADALLFLTDIFEKEGPEPAFLKTLNDIAQRIPLVAAINKVDLLAEGCLSETRREEVGSLEGILDKWKSLLPSAQEIYTISALEGTNVESLLDGIAERLPEGPPLFDEDTMSDRPMRFFASEIIREKVFLSLGQELPYCSEVTIESFVEKEDMTVIKATIIVSRDSQKGMVIGKQGSMIKKIGMEARESLQDFLGQKVFLDLKVKVDKNWRSNTKSLRNYGYLQ